MMKKIVAALLTLALLCGLCALAEGDHSQVADASEMTDVVDVVEEGMVPVTADQLNEGTYQVAVESSSSMFKVLSCEITVADGAMTAKLYMKSDAYLYMYPGAAEEAAQADEADLAALETDGETFAFTLPVDALDAGYVCAAFSARKQVWYPRTLLFRADSLPEEAWPDAAKVTAETLGLADGTYTVAATLEGGRTTVESPATLTVSGGECTVALVFSTSKIGYVQIGDTQYLPEAGDDGAQHYVLPVAAFDRKLALTINSTAISPATDVAYSLTLDSASIAAVE